MNIKTPITLLFAFVVVLSFATASPLWAEMLPEGVTMVTLKESPASHLPGIAKLRLVELRMVPGAKWPHTIAESGFCTAIQGNLTVEKDGKTNTHFTGETWVMKKGATLTAYNRGTTDHVQRMWLLIEK